ncbi:hypothetical protein [Vibrio cholerae]|uniref:hypothetical protein n=1 Tax=Vibrio cholerae TaxID=666 RepID=UPI0029C2E682|nr:hypothetical protein [Vibrio cholerae]MDX5050080.1 hypothetical protein [Vibrio cholerae]
MAKKRIKNTYRVAGRSFKTEEVRLLLSNQLDTLVEPIKLPISNITGIGSLHDWQVVTESNVKPILANDPFSGHFPFLTQNGHKIKCKPDLTIGDYIYVREAFATLGYNYEEVSALNSVSIFEVRFRASENPKLAFEKDWEVRGYKWKTPLQMPRNISRITLKINHVEPIEKDGKFYWKYKFDIIFENVDKHIQFDNVPVFKKII